MVVVRVGLPHISVKLNEKDGTCTTQWYRWFEETVEATLINLATKADKATEIIAGYHLTGGGDLSADVTLAVIPFEAFEIAYDNSVSLLTATDVQGALDEITQAVADITDIAMTVIIDVVSAEGAIDNAELLPGIVSGLTINFAAGLPDASGFAKTPAAASAVFTFTKYPGATVVATVTFALGASTPTFTAASGFSIGPGEAIYPTGPSPADANLSDVVISWKGTFA